MTTTRRRSAWFAAALLALCVVAWLVAVVLAVTRPVNVDAFRQGDFVWGLGFLAFPTVGAVIAWKKPENILGWLFLIGPAIAGLGVLAKEIVYHQQEDASAWLAYTADGMFILGISLMVAFFLALFPTGHFPTRRWRILGVLAITGIAATVAWQSVRSCVNVIVVYQPDEVPNPSCTDPLQSWFLRFENPAGLAYPGGEALWGLVGGIGGFLVLVAMLGGVISLFFRYRSGSRVERAQLRWLVAVIVAIIPVFLAMVVAQTFFEIELETLSSLVSLVVLIGIPIAIGIAILRHQLFDIDRIIKRTFTYTIVAGVLVVVFAVGAVWLPTQLSIADNSLAVAATTLAVAAMFNPLRRRVQRFVDRRFYRSPYDAEAVTGDLAKKLRDQVEPEEIAEEWADAVDQTLHPAAIGSWISVPLRDTSRIS